MPEDYIRLAHVLDAMDLLHRWPGVSEGELAAMIKEKTLPAYWQKKRLKAPNGQVLSFCTPGAKPWMQMQGDTASYDWDDIVFDTVDVERLEEQHTELTWPVPEIDSTSKSDQQAEQNESEWVQCDTLAKRWGWSPFDVVTLLNSGLIPFKNFWNHEPYVDCLNEFSIHQVDLLRWEIANAEKIHNPPALAKDGERLREENKALAVKVAELEVKNSSLRFELESLRFELEAERAKPARTGPPEHLERAKDEKTAERWKRNMRSGLTLAVHVIQVGKAFTTEELRKVCSTLALPALGEDALKIFRETMPPECINTGGRPSKKKTSE